MLNEKKLKLFKLKILIKCKKYPSASIVLSVNAFLFSAARALVVDVGFFLFTADQKEGGWGCRKGKGSLLCFLKLINY